MTEEEKKGQTKLHEAITMERLHEKMDEDHRNLRTFLEETIQPKMKFLFARYQEADQIIEATREGSVKTPSFMPEVEVDYWPAVRVLVVQAVYSIWDREGRPTKDRREPIPIVQEQIQQLIKIGKWPKKWQVPGRDTIIRRLNESADKRHYPDGPTPCIAVRPGRYMPSPHRFEEPIRSTLIKFAETWK